MGTLVGTFEKYPPLTHWVKVRRIVSEPSMYSTWTHWVIDPLPPVNIMLRLAPQIQGNLTSETMDGAGLLWDHLEKQYGKPGIIATYLEFKAAMDIKINDNEDPTTAIDKMTAHFA